MVSIKVVLAILFIHWIADFVLQTDKQAKGKSNNWVDLLSHTSVYSLVWLGVGSGVWWYINTEPKFQLPVVCFVLITFVCHTITDYFTSRLNTKLWAKGDVHNFFVSIGFDQWLHYAQLFLTYKLVT